MASNTEDLSRFAKQSLALAYPCRVEGGVDGVKFCLALYSLYRKNITDALSLSSLCKALDWDSSELEEKTEDDVKKRAEELNATKWRHTTPLDETNMAGDHDQVEKTLKVCGFEPNLGSQVINEFGNERVTDIRSRLTYVNSSLPPTIHQHTILCIIGHGLSESMARSIQNPGTCKWPWKMYDCQDKNGIGKTEEKVKEEAAKGDIVVFSSGLLSPDWVVDRLRDRDRNSKGIKSSVVIVIDSCYSGVWTGTISARIRGEPLDHTRVIVQTACRENEASYGNIFWPTFRALQECDKSDLASLEDASEPDDLETPLQTPTLFVSDNSDTPYTKSTREVDLGGTKMRFFTEGRFFEKFCDKAFNDHSRGIPDDKIRAFFDSFGKKTIIEIRCYRLKLYKKKDPMANILVQCHSLKAHFHLHLHFADFPCTKENLVALSHVETAPSRPPSKYTWEEVGGSKNTISERDGRRWRHIQSSCLVDTCIAFVGRATWDDKGRWQMKEAKPQNLIRDRSAVLQEVIDVSAKLKDEN